MAFRETERRRPVEHGVVIFPSFADEVTRHFRDHDIAWWGGTGSPPESPISSQVACINHLEPARRDRAIALGVARVVVGDAEAVLPVEDGGFVGYEWIGERNYLGERSHSRGANSTSLDAVMVIKAGGTTLSLLIEWKYTESYRSGKSRAVSSRGTDRVAIYRALLEQDGCPIEVPGGNLAALFYDPIEQLMRQTLLGWQMVGARELGATDWRHVWVVPEGNTALLGANTAPDLPGDTLEEAWRGVLQDPSKFAVMTPMELLAEVDPSPRWTEWRQWLAGRYGT